MIKQSFDISGAQNSTKINSLTGMRFFAIMIIVISHLEFLKNYSNIGYVYWQYFHNATLGVDFFFVLSGFGLMLSDINRNGFTIYNKINLKNLINYGVNHIRKIYPLYISTIVIGIPLYIYEAHVSGKSFLLIVKLIFLKLLACIFLIQSVFGMSWLSHAFNGVCWFLSCLFCIYLVSPIYINILKKFCINIKRIILCLISFPLLASVLGFLFKQIEKATFFDDFTYGSPWRRIIYVIFGMTLAILINKYKNSIKIKNINFYEIIIGLMSLLWFVFRRTILFNIHYISLIYIVDLIVVGLIILTLAYNKGIISKFLSQPKIVYLGELSMYIFIIHYPIRIYLGTICNFYNLNEWYVALAMIFIIFTSTYFISKYLYTCSKK